MLTLILWRCFNEDEGRGLKLKRYFQTFDLFSQYTALTMHLVDYVMTNLTSMRLQIDSLVGFC